LVPFTCEIGTEEILIDYLEPGPKRFFIKVKNQLTQVGSRGLETISVICTSIIPAEIKPWTHHQDKADTKFLKRTQYEDKADMKSHSEE
jgi:hypothetical protein